MNKNNYLKDQVRVQMQSLNLIMVEKTAEEVIGGKTKSMQEGGEHHNFLSVGCWDVLPFGRPPLEHCTIRVEAILNQFEDFAFICDRVLKHFWVGGGHGKGKENPKRGIEGSTRGRCAQGGRKWRQWSE
jgi:hypothetical protein